MFTSFRSFHFPELRVYVAHRDGSARRLITQHREYPCFAADWSPDDAKIAYTVGCDVDFMDLFVVSRDGSGLRRLARGGYDKGAFYAVGPHWSPEGRSILVAGLNARAPAPTWFRLFLIGPDGRRRAIPRSALDPGPTLGRYSWSPDGKRIFFIDDRAGSPALFVIKSARPRAVVVSRRRPHRLHACRGRHEQDLRDARRRQQPARCQRNCHRRRQPDVGASS